MSGAHSAAEEPLAPPAVIDGYAAVLEQCSSGDQERVAIRSYRKGGADYRLTVDPRTLHTHLEPLSGLRCVADRSEADALLAGTAYRRALDAEREHEDLMQNAGLVRSLIPVSGYFLTADLCPSSKKGFNQELFETLEHASQVHGGDALPMALSVSGGWIRHHGESLQWLRKEMEAGRLQITWINHTMTHPYDSHAELSHNFMLETASDPVAEILELEMMLVAQGIAPSVFFRFPGLVSSPQLIEVLESLHLVALGSDAWLAKGQQPKPGSVILIHANLNEQIGVKLMLEWVASQPKDSIRFLPLQAIAGS